MRTFGKFWRIIYPAFLLFGSYFAVYIIAILAYGTFFHAKYPDIDRFMHSAGDIVSLTALIVGGIAVYYFYRKDYPVEFKLFTDSPKYIIFTVILGAALGHGLNILVSLVNISGFLGTYNSQAPAGSAAVIAVTVIKSVVLAPVAEELTFRGLIFRRTEAYVSFWPAALVSSVLFGLYHMNLLQGIYAFLYGIMLCLVYKTFRNILAPMIMHAAANAFALISAYTGLDYHGIPVYIAVMAAAFGISAAIYFRVIRRAVK